MLMELLAGLLWGLEVLIAILAAFLLFTPAFALAELVLVLPSLFLHYLYSSPGRRSELRRWWANWRGKDWCPVVEHVGVWGRIQDIRVRGFWILSAAAAWLWSYFALWVDRQSRLKLRRSGAETVRFLTASLEDLVGIAAETGRVPYLVGSPIKLYTELIRSGSKKVGARALYQLLRERRADRERWLKLILSFDRPRVEQVIEQMKWEYSTDPLFSLIECGVLLKEEVARDLIRSIIRCCTPEEACALLDKVLPDPKALSMVLAGLVGHPAAKTNTEPLTAAVSANLNQLLRQAEAETVKLVEELVSNDPCFARLVAAKFPDDLAEIAVRNLFRDSPDNIEVFQAIALATPLSRPKATTAALRALAEVAGHVVAVKHLEQVATNTSLGVSYQRKVALFALLNARTLLDSAIKAIRPVELTMKFWLEERQRHGGLIEALFTVPVPELRAAAHGLSTDHWAQIFRLYGEVKQDREHHETEHFILGTLIISAPVPVIEAHLSHLRVVDAQSYVLGRLHESRGEPEDRMVWSSRP